LAQCGRHPDKAEANWFKKLQKVCLPQGGGWKTPNFSGKG